jgi:AcrR family transcriptional regulator
VTSVQYGRDRRTAILDAAGKIFLRYGYKKTSMDDLARAAGLSRQALYLHFRSKEDLFRAAILKIIENDRQAYRAAVAREELDLSDRLLGAFQAFHGKSISQVDSQYVGELLEAAASLVGDAPAEHDRRFLADLTKLLSESDHIHGSANQVTPRELAETLFATSWGFKHRVTTASEYRSRMSVALRIILGSASEDVGGRRRGTSRKR